MKRFTQVILGFGMMISVSSLALSQESETEITTDMPLINQYGRACAEKLGKIPSFSCFDGKIIPITVDGVEVNKATEKCDKPIYLGVPANQDLTNVSNAILQGRCKPNARLGKIDSGNPDVDTIFICRRYNDVRDPMTVGFSDVAIVQHNRVSGDTCYFQALGTADLYGKRVPSPSELEVSAEVLEQHPEAKSAGEFWMSPASLGNSSGVHCVKCHDSDAFIHTPYVDQVLNDDGTKLLPEVVDGKYNMIAARYGLYKWPKSFNVEPKTSGAKSCTSCHRIGSMNTCGEFASDSVGNRSSLDKYKTDLAKTWMNKRWMEPHGNYSSKEQWNHFVKPSADEAIRCCNVVNRVRGWLSRTLTPDMITEIEGEGCKITPISNNLD